ncbi:MAG: alpha/beta hydrolase [Anaerolineaceae bacterium]|nr:alpha/beta hydrolase [Anaerolineaceae bacterium]
MAARLRCVWYVIIALLVAVLGGCAEKPQAEVEGSGYPPLSLPDTEVRSFKSTITGREYDLYIRFPSSYERYTEQRYPVLYSLDGQWDFKMLDSIYGGLNYDQYVPEMIIVGITYSGEDADYEALRAMDYTPVQDLTIRGSGGARRFQRCLKEEIIPLIEREYRADPEQRVLMGHSYGGTFTLYSLFSEPELFFGYVAASPAVTFGDDYAFKQEEEYFAARQDLPVRLHLTVGSEESLAYPVQQFMDVLRGRNYEGLVLETQVIEGERHAGVKPEAFNRGLRFIFGD